MYFSLPQLALIDADIFNEIRYTELLKQAWSKADKDRLVPQPTLPCCLTAHSLPWFAASVRPCLIVWMPCLFTVQYNMRCRPEMCSASLHVSTKFPLGLSP